MANKPGMRRLVIRGNVIFFHMSANAVENLLVLLDSEQTVFALDNLVGSARIESRDNSSVLISSKWKLCLVAIAPRLLHPDDRLHRNLRQPTDSLQIVADLILLESKLCLVAHILKLTSSARTGNRTFRLRAIRRRLYHADESRKPIRLFRLHHTCFHEVSGHRVFDKPCKTIGLSDSLTLTAHVLDSYLKHFILLKFHTLIPLLNS